MGCSASTAEGSWHPGAAGGTALCPRAAQVLELFAYHSAVLLATQSTKPSSFVSFQGSTWGKRP